MGKSSTTLVNILVADVNDNLPIFQPFVYSIGINPRQIHSNQEILHVLASDMDRGPIRYSMSPITPHLAAFSVNPQSGAIVLTSTFDSDAENLPTSAELRIVATDSGGRSSTEPALIQIDFLEETDFCVGFSKTFYEFSIPEDILPGIGIGTVELESRHGRLKDKVNGTKKLILKSSNLYN